MWEARIERGRAAEVEREAGRWERGGRGLGEKRDEEERKEVRREQRKKEGEATRGEKRGEETN